MSSKTEAALIQRLQHFLPPDVHVSRFPDAPGELTREFQNGEVYVFYAGGVRLGNGAPETTGRISERMQRWQFTARHRSRPYLNAIVDAALVILQGFEPPGARGRLIYVSDTAPELLDARWTVFITFDVPALVTTIIDPEPLTPIVQATFDRVDAEPHTIDVEKP